MQTTELSELKTRIEGLLRNSTVGAHLREVEVEADRDQDGDPFLRVRLVLSSLSEIKDDDLIAQIEDIEEAVLAIDDRYPSVRFSEAA